MPAKKRTYRHLERPIQRSFFAELSLYPKVSPIFAIPNGGSRHILEAVHLKLTGVKAGIPDIFAAIPSEPYHGLFIEFKAGKGKASPAQLQMIDLLEKRGYTCKVCYSSSEAIQVLKDYLKVDSLRDFL